jgi:N-acetylglutamate synthase-like GNAT family acetyltransferase
MIKIRKIGEADTAGVAKLIKTTLLETNARHYPKKIIDSLIEDYSAKNLKIKMKTRTFFVAANGKSIVGVIALTNDGWIGGLFVHPKYQKQGVGSRLVLRVKREAAVRGFDMIRSHVAINSVGFYKKLGFRIVKKVVFKKAGEVYRMAMKVL